MKRFGALFDLDGVLVDTETIYTRFWSETDRLFPTGIDDYARYIKGMTLTKILNYYPTQEVRDEIVRRLNEFQATMEYPMMDGAMELLGELRQRGIPTAIVTSSDNKKMTRLFKHQPLLREMVDHVIDASQVTRSKPDPQGYLLGAKAIGVEPENCFVFEDSFQGLAAGRSSGAMVIALATTFPRERIEREADADMIIDSLAGMGVDKMLALAKSISRL